jgi:hypothetical protein
MGSFSETNFNDGSEHFSATNQELCPVLLKCGTPGLTILPGNVDGITTTTNVASVTVNTACLCNPCIKLEFTSNIIVPAATLSVTISFQIFKLCNNQFQAIPVGPQWSFSRATAIGVALASSDTITFFICDCGNCFNECCTYTTQVTATILDAGGGGGGDVTILNAILSAFVVNSVNQCC